MMTPYAITTVTPTVFLRGGEHGLEQRALVRIAAGSAADGVLHVSAAGREYAYRLQLAPGETDYEVFLPELHSSGEVLFRLRVGPDVAAQLAVAWHPPRHWTVHVVQLSHHDVGYTDLASHVLPEHARWLDAALEMADATRAYPEEARFRIVVEQIWSLEYYLRHAAPARVDKMLGLLRAGEIEMTALFGNLTTELCGHETLARAVYPAFRLRRQYDLPLISAEHNDIPGFAGGLCRVLAGAGVRLFCPGLPLYYSWGGSDLPSFWDEGAIFGTCGTPGAFWWETPDGQRVLFWCNNQGCGGDCHPSLPGLADHLQHYETQGYPYDLLRWPVSGGARDNSPYIQGYADTIRDWNRTWAWPRLVSSTNTRFYAEFRKVLPADLPVWRGDVPGQDYPVGAMSTAAATAVNRNNHASLQSAAAAASAAGLLVDFRYPGQRITAACEEVLFHDEHTWGHHFPCGPTAATSELEKAVHAHRGATLLHDVGEKALAALADAVRLETEDIHLLVFNPLPRERSGLVTAPLREIDNCGSEMIRADDASGGCLRPVLLGTRWHVNPPPEIVAGNFALIDVESGTEVAYQLENIDSPYAPVPYAAQRLGLGAGSKRYGFFEQPSGIRRNLCFRADQVPALGYRLYRLAPRETAPVFTGPVRVTETVIENEWYRVALDAQSGYPVSLQETAGGREWLDPAASHPFGAVIVRKPDGSEEMARVEEMLPPAGGPLGASLRLRLRAPGHPVIEETITLRAGGREIELAVHVLKDPTPLLEAFLAFPFHLPGGQFRCETPLAVTRPGRDHLPGAYTNRLAVQHWVSARNGVASLAWASLDAPIVSLGRLWPSRVSPAHACATGPALDAPPPAPGELTGGAIYSLLFANNFGTNFAVSQSGSVLFRYRFTLQSGALNDTAAAAFGWDAAQPLRPIFTRHPGPRPLPPAQGVLEIDHPAVQMVALKQAEDGRGLVLRLWNVSADAAEARIILPHHRLQTVQETNLAEEDTGVAFTHETHGVTVTLPPHGLQTVRLILY